VTRDVVVHAIVVRAGVLFGVAILTAMILAAQAATRVAATGHHLGQRPIQACQARLVRRTRQARRPGCKPPGNEAAGQDPPRPASPSPRSLLIGVYVFP
jgi:hypothetical protein